ncbi:MAG: 2-oxo acid dehydrogenase subunit E2, partial [Rhodospirillaceae bacterium]|nr:2-oxo acid dehydrogenase subunit E2 [Rhodospirillaceae bacterium]
SVETDKAVVEIPAPWAGRIAALRARPGDVVKVGTPLIDFGEPAAADSGTVVGAMPKESARIDEAAVPEGAARTKVKATPAVRALARRLGVDLAAVDASGPDGLVTAEDVRRVAAMLAGREPPEPLQGVRRVMAQKMAQSHAEVVPANVVDEVDVEAWPAGTDVTLRLIRAVAAGCRAEPSLNAWFDSQQGTRRLFRRIDLGVAVATEEGLFVPVLRDVGSRDAADLRQGLDRMKRDVEARAIPLEELRGATITLSNFGVFGAGRFAEMVIIPPQVAIVGAGAIRPAVLAVDGRPAVRRVLPLSLTFDHRVVTGSEAAHFLAAMMEDLRKPA